MAEAYDHVDPRTDAEVARDEASAKSRTAKDKARTVAKTTEPKPIKAAAKSK